MKKTICVLGAGIGGLTAAAYLAMRGHKVTILEKAITVGGSAGWFVRKQRTFPTGATIAFGLEKGGLLSTLLNELQIELESEVLQHPMNVALPDRTIAIYQDPILWNEELNRVFYERSADVMKFWSELTSISDAVFDMTMCRVGLPVRRWYDLGALPQYALKHPLPMLRLARYARWTVEDLLVKYTLDTYLPFRQFLNAQLLDAVQTDATEAALLPSSLALTIYRRGSFHIQGGMGQLSKALADRIEEELGGEIILSSPVSDVQVDVKTKEWHVHSKKRSATYQHVINNTGISFGSGTSYADQGLFSWGAFRIDALVHEGLWREGLGARKLPFSYQVVPHPDLAEFFTDVHGPIYVTFNHSLDKRGSIVKGEITMTCSIHTDLKQWLSLSKEGYKLKKDQLAKTIFSEIEKEISFKAHLLYAESGTPLTYQKFIGKGEVGGFPLTVKNSILKPHGIRSSLPHMYIAGEQTFPGPGTLSSMLSGFFSARAIEYDK